MLRQAERWRQIDEWRRHSAKKRRHLFDRVSLDKLLEDGYDLAQLGASPADLAERRLDCEYLLEVLKARGMARELKITKMVYAGYSIRAIARHLHLNFSTFFCQVLPRWRGICRQILDS